MNKPLRRTDKKDTSMFAKFSENDIANAEIAFNVARINAEFQAKQKVIDNRTVTNIMR